MDKARLRAVRKARGSGEAATSRGIVMESGTEVPKTVVADPLSPVVVGSDSEDVQAGFTRKRKRTARMVEGAPRQPQVDLPESSSPPPAGPVQKIDTVEGAMSAMVSARHLCRMVGEFVGSFGSLQSEYEARGKQIEEQRKLLKEAEVVMRKCQQVAEKRQEEAVIAKAERDSAMGAHAESQKRLQKALDELDIVRVEVEKAQSIAASAVSRAKASDAEAAQLRAEIRSLEEGALDQFEKGYAEALKHVKCLHPEEDLSVYDPFYEIHEGKLVDPETLTVETENPVAGERADGGESSKAA